MGSDHTEKTKDRVFGVSLGDDTEGASKHGLLLERLSALPDRYKGVLMEVTYQDVDQQEHMGNAPGKVSMPVNKVSVSSLFKKPNATDF